MELLLNVIATVYIIFAVTVIGGLIFDYEVGSSLSKKDCMILISYFVIQIFYILKMEGWV